MADRTDIDALLIGALYGELAPVDEARLSAHLESHPADRSALTSLEHTRAAVRASGLRRVLFEPPQAVSALLVQEAARRAPRVRARATESWFHRLVRSLTAHPALAAAMTVVVIAGVASTLYVKHADKFGEPSPADEERVASITRQAPIDPASANATPPAAGAGSAAATDDVVGSAPPPAAAAPAQVADRSAVEKKGKAEAESEAMAFKRDDAAGDGMAAPAMSKPSPAMSKPSPAKRKPLGIAVEGHEMAPKDLDERKLAKIDDSDGAFAKSAPSAGAAKPSPAVTLSRPAAPPAAEPAADKASDGSLVGWAQRQHAQVVALVRANNCRAAANAATEIYNRAPDFYATSVESDREIRPCLSYVTSERERVDRARAAKRGNAAADQGSSATGQPAPSTTPAQVPRP